MTSHNLREKFLEFFIKRGHKIIPSASLVPENDPTVLFTTAGMHPLIPYLLGEKHPQGTRLCNVQKCIRTGDIDEVGDPWHLTFFEMLGVWLLGEDNIKQDAIKWSSEFLREELEIDTGKLAVTYFKGEPENNIPADNEAAKIWREKEHGIVASRIQALGREDNWWGPVGESGPCGPDTEIFYWSGSEKIPKEFTPGNKKWVEIWNNVFMEHNKTPEGKYESLKQKNLDTGVGLERTLAILNNLKSVYETDLFVPIINKIKELLPNPNNDVLSEEQIKSVRIIADHLRAATFILAEGISPSNIGQGYVLRRLIRRAVRHAKHLNIAQEKNLLEEVSCVVVDIMKTQYPELAEKQENILEALKKEEEKFNKTLERGLKEFSKLEGNGISGQDAFNLYQSYGFPLELTKEIAQEKGLKVDEKSFQEELKKHQALSRQASAGMFKGGLSEASEITAKYHTATHLLHQALRQILGDHIAQKGSNITPERMRFDFSHPEKMTPEQIQKVEALVNQKIKENLVVTMREMSPEEANKERAIGLFGAKYGAKVKVYSIQGFSREICGGPHIQNTSELGHFKILKEESSSANIRRIKAVLE